MVQHTSWHPPGNSSSIKPEFGLGFRAWLASPLGKYFLYLEQQRLESIIPTLFGYNAVIIGEENFSVCFLPSKINNKLLLNDDYGYKPSVKSGFCYARRDRFPIETNSIDVVYCAHSLEFASNPHEVLREIYRVMRGDGHLIITMFNPLSFWGIWRSVAKISSDIPWKANFMSVTKLKDWLALLGFDIIRINNFGFNWPINKSNFPHNLPICERIGQKLELPIGAAFVIEAAKRVVPLTPIVKTWQNTTELNESDLTEPTA